LDYLNLVSNFDGKTIRLPFLLAPLGGITKLEARDYQLVLDTGADITALTEEFLKRSGYSKFQRTGTKKRTATGETELYTCEINGMTIANQFKIGKMKVDVLSGWDTHSVVGVIGMDILSKLTFILSHEYKKFMLSEQAVPELSRLFEVNHAKTH